MIRLFLRSLRFLALWIIILHLGMWVAMVVIHVVVAIDFIRSISWSTSQWFRDYPP